MNLTGTNWKIKDTPTLSAIGAKSVNFKSNGNTYSSLTIAADSIKYGNTTVYSSGWVSSEYQYIYFDKTSAGTDASDSTLSDWIQANADQFLQAFYDLNNIVQSGSHTITARGRATGYTDSDPSNSISITVYAVHVIATGCTMAGLPYLVQNGSSRTLTFTALSGYALPATVTVTGCSYTWDQTTGIMVLSEPTQTYPQVTVVAIEVEQLDTPENLFVENLIAHCDPVQNATSYEFYVDTDDNLIGTYTPN